MKSYRIIHGTVNLHNMSKMVDQLEQILNQLERDKVYSKEEESRIKATNLQSNILKTLELFKVELKETELE